MTSAAGTDARRHALILVLLCVPLFFVGLGCYDLDMRGEPREGITAWETIHSDFLLPRLNGDRLPEKPLMFPWLASLSMRAFGETSEWALRLPSAVLGVGLVLVVRALGARLLGARLGFVAALAFAGTFLVVNLARRARVDMTLSFFVCVALLQFVAMFQEDEAAPGRPPATWRNVVLWLSLTFATLTKGPLGVILPGLAIGSFLLLRRRLGFAWRLCPWWGAVFFVGVVGGWYAHGLADAGSRFGFRTFLMENVLMFLGEEGGGGHSHGTFYFLPRLVFVGAPWAVLLPAAMLLVARRARGSWSKEPLLFPIAWFASMLIFFSAARGKRMDYMLPLLPAASILVVAALDSAVTTADVLSRRAVKASAWAVAGLGTVFVVLAAVLVWGPPGTLHDAIAERREGGEAGPLFAVIEGNPFATSVVLAMFVVAAAAPAVALAAGRPAWGVFVATAATAVAAPVAILTYLPTFREHETLKPFTAEMLQLAGPDATIRSWRTYQPQAFYYANRRLPPIPRRELDGYLAAPGVGWFLSERGAFDALTPAQRERLEVVLESKRTDEPPERQAVVIKRRAL
jgi:4-amino-4-deoxy-L-arabinose transferase-like glycosyltransferase